MGLVILPQVSTSSDWKEGQTRKRDLEQVCWAGKKRGPPSLRDVYGHCPVPTLVLYLLSENAQVGESSQYHTPSSVTLHLIWGKGYLIEPTASWFSQLSSWMSHREPLVSASLLLRLQTWAAAPGSLCLFSVGARYLTQVILLACQTLY